jgi:hypothetical protein
MFGKIYPYVQEEDGRLIFKYLRMTGKDTSLGNHCPTPPSSLSLVLREPILGLPVFCAGGEKITMLVNKTELVGSLPK